MGHRVELCAWSVGTEGELALARFVQVGTECECSEEPTSALESPSVEAGNAKSLTLVQRALLTFCGKSG